MKTVFSKPSDVAHEWANETQESARYSGGNFFFHQQTIYSYGYHFPIARHIENAKGENAILFTNRAILIPRLNIYILLGTLAVIRM